jgi:hypothetical protein
MGEGTRVQPDVSDQVPTIPAFEPRRVVQLIIGELIQLAREVGLAASGEKEPGDELRVGGVVSPAGHD